MRVHLDFETYAEVDLKACGLSNYLLDPRFEVTLTALAFDDGPVLQWEGAPVALFQALSRIDGLNWHAYNAAFERGVLERLGVSVPNTRWRCTMAHSYCRGFSGGLSQVGEQVGLGEDEAKLSDGSRLVAKFCKPAPKNHKADRYSRENSPVDWERFMLYSRLDVVAERGVWRYIDQWPWTEDEQRLWELDQAINQRGVPVDVAMATAAVARAEHWRKVYDRQIRDLTGGIGGGQVGKLVEWLQGQGYEADNLRAESVDRVLQSAN